MQTRKQTERDARELFRLCLVNGALDEARVRRVVQQVIAAGRASGLGMLSRFQRFVRLDRAGHRADVSSAVPLPADVRSNIEAALIKLYGPDMATSFTDDPALIGGVRIKVGSDVYDGSVSGRLAALQSGF
jgi:F-type H+-transporting ATPase subunit delta